MTRKAFFRGLFSGAMAGAAVAQLSAKPASVTLVDVADVKNRESYVPGRTKTFIDGVEVPLVTRTEVYSDGTGVVYCFRPGPGGERYIDPATGDVAREVRRGIVRLVRG